MKSPATTQAGIAEALLSGDCSADHAITELAKRPSSFDAEQSSLLPNELDAQEAFRLMRDAGLENDVVNVGEWSPSGTDAYFITVLKDVDEPDKLELLDIRWFSEARGPALSAYSVKSTDELADFLAKVTDDESLQRWLSSRQDDIVNEAKRPDDNIAGQDNLFAKYPGSDRYAEDPNIHYVVKVETADGEYIELLAERFQSLGTAIDAYKKAERENRYSGEAGGVSPGARVYIEQSVAPRGFGWPEGQFDFLRDEEFDYPRPVAEFDTEGNQVGVEDDWAIYLTSLGEAKRPEPDPGQQRLFADWDSWKAYMLK